MSTQPGQEETLGGDKSAWGAGDPSDILTFDDIGKFSVTVAASGITIDFDSLRSLNTNFLQASEGHLILSLKHFNSDQPDNLLFLSDKESVLYSATPPSPNQIDAFSGLFTEPHGKSTALAFLTLRLTGMNYQARLESLIERMEGFEMVYDAREYRQLALDFARLYDRAEDFYEILLRLEETGIKQVETRYLSFDYRVLIAEADNLVNRCRNRFGIFKEFARDHELQATTELNLRMERLNVVVKRLTAITLILMIPTLIASHFGMNFS